MSTTTTTDDDTIDDIAVVQIHTGDGDGADIVFEFNKICIAVSIFPSHSSQNHLENRPGQAIEDHLINLLTQAIIGGDNYDDILDEILDVIFVAGRPQVLVEDQEMLCKARPTGLEDPNLKQELESFQKIAKASQCSSLPIRVLKLLGYVKQASNGHIVGLLCEWIASDLPRYPKFETVDQLHKIGMILEDGKISNVVIGNDDNAWLIDFGGGWTKGWVDEELADTIEGDGQAVRNIAKFLGVD
ncbi:hypothetical protein B7463_g2664, partial [Scytalidium lignicola]